MLTRTATADWEGSISRGTGRLALGSGIWEGPYTLKSRLGEQGTNPEELLAAAHAGCLTMALGVVLARARKPPEHLHTDATVHFDSEGEGWAISHIELDVHGRVPGVDEAAFEQAAKTAERHCPVSKALAGTRIELRAKLDG